MSKLLASKKDLQLLSHIFENTPLLPKLQEIKLPEKYKIRERYNDYAALVHNI
jgi:hypothetical protein